MNKIVSILLVSIFAMFFASCKSPEPLKPSSNPQIILGHLEYTGNTFAPIAMPKPYKYAMYDRFGLFLAYVDISNIVMGSAETFMDCDVMVRGVIHDTKDGLVIKADYIKKNK